MKALTCEMCGSQDMVKQDGYFICQHCGTKYSVEEAKKLMIEGTVEVHGTVKVDDSDIVKKHLHQGHELDKDKLIKELGDVAWYLAEACFALDIELETVLNLNIEKLKKRYPEGFEVNKSVNRSE